MTSPLPPAAGSDTTAPAEVPVRARADYRTTVFYGLAAALALLVFAVRTPGGSQTRFQLATGSGLFTIPELPVPSAPVAWLLALLLVGAAVWAGRLARRRRPVAPWLHIAVGVTFVVCFLVWVGAGRASVIPVTSLLAGALALSVPLIFGALSGVVCERSGVINIAIEGQLLFGAFAAAVIASRLATPSLGLVAAPVAGAAVGAVLAWFAVRYQVNQIIVGVVLNTLVLGLTGFFFSTVLSEDAALWNARQPLGLLPIPVLSEIPVLGPVLFKQSVLVYLMYVLVVVVHIMLFHSRWGLRTRAVGEHPKAADTVGIKVNRRRVANVILGGAIAGLGGAFFTVGSGLAFGREMSAGQGFIALAAMILGRWSPFGAVLAALMFGFSRNLGNVLSTIGAPVPSEVLLMLPYLVTIFAVAGLVGRLRPPAANGQPYVK